MTARRLATALLLCASACGGARVTVDQTIEMQRRVETMLSSGGYSCAPRELALARANVDFARVELEHGELSRAAEHLAEADLQTRAAEQLSAATRCVPNPAQQPALATGVPDADHDGDRVPDSSDQCPGQPEDLDGTDGDGCPRGGSDRDGDGVEDSVDACPDVSGSLASKGCLRGKYRGVDVTDDALRLSEPVAFEGETERIVPESFAVLDTIAQILADNPNITLEVQGHTDSPGEPDSNQRLSQARAEAVIAYLQARGVAAARLTAMGYGETRPIESNRTSQGRAINRRVEFVRTDGGRQ